MSIKVTVNSIPKYRISIDNKNETVVRTVGIGGSVTSTGVNQLVDLSDVDASSLDDGETIVYDANTSTFVIKSIPMIDSGTF